MRVTHVLAPATFGGLERVVHALSTGQQRRGHRVDVVLLLEAGVEEPFLAAQLQGTGVSVVTVVTSGRAYWTQLRRLREHCKAVGPDVIHSHGYLPDVLSRILIGSVPARRVSTVHGFVGGTRRARLYEWLQCRAYGAIEPVAVSKKLAADLVQRGVNEARVHTIPNAVPPAREPFSREVARQRLGVSEDLFSIGWVGRVSHEKGLDVLLDATKLLNDLPIQLTVVGDGAARKQLEEFGAGVHVAVNWAGMQEDASRMLAAFDLVVLSSRTEGTPIILLEAMSASIPVVATSVGGVPDVISQQEGVLVPTENPAALAAGIRAAYMDRPAAMKRADAGRARLAAEFSIDSWLDRYDSLYASLKGKGQ
jgi:glycosyltransferase involved in cell wall biosynthesis